MKVKLIIADINTGEVLESCLLAPTAEQAEEATSPQRFATQIVNNLSFLYEFEEDT